jgi:alkylhydroperoxidase family enzyme
VIADPRAVAARWRDPRRRMLSEIAMLVTEAPWTLSPEHRGRSHSAGLSDEDLLHAIALSAFFGHLNRIADAVGVPLDYEVQHQPPPAEPATPALPRAPMLCRGSPVLAIDARPATAAALAAWRDHVLARAPENRAIAAWVAELLGDGDAASCAPGPAVPDAAAKRALIEQITLAPWRLDEAAFAPLRALGRDDAAVFDLCAAASTFGVMSRIRVALIALAG